MADLTRLPVPLLLLAGTVLAGLLFMTFPGLDLWVSGLFWRPDGGFFLRDWAPFRAIYDTVPIVTWALVIGLLLLALIGWILGRAIGPFDRRTIPFLLLSIAIGPGLLTNTVLKDHWGRARPNQVVQFGGTKQFTPVLQPSDQCGHNCSFPSGHGAMAFSLVGLGFLPATRRRRQWVTGTALGFGTLVALVRIGQGGHFLSDNVFAALLVGAVTWGLHRWVVEADGLDRLWTRRLARRLTATLTGTVDQLHNLPPSPRRGWLIGGSAALVAIVVSVAWIDRPLALYFKADDDRLVLWFRWITQFGLGWGWLVISAVLGFGLWAASRAPRAGALRERLVAWSLVPTFVFLSVLVSGLVADIVKIILGRTRPKLLFLDGSFGLTGLSFRSDHWSFPSGHVTNVAALAAALTMLWPRHVAAYALFVALIALSRIATTQHFLSDTIGAAFLAILVTAYIRGVFTRSGLALADLKAGVLQVRSAVSWRQRLLGR
ncbi:MAG TPA: phosphatase PAP2 family protein [Aliidongia sp.]|uniref:phosphatase PAP2 family protein n=1 Tax=Aliidongia sp. TaxID=1914230 RepID=UPI002DDCBB60|nr:phosphatase PAP2 family protein [Aliidongia sp.]HEV2673232.1 phosphatase PAP2 family protein [Aliidongia sp.]